MNKIITTAVLALGVAVSPLVAVTAHATGECPSPSCAPDPGYPQDGSPCPFLNAPDSVCPNKMPQYQGGSAQWVPPQIPGAPPIQQYTPPPSYPPPLPVQPPPIPGNCQSMNTPLTHQSYIACCGDSRLAGNPQC
jgi:hypothetical protein